MRLSAIVTFLSALAASSLAAPAERKAGDVIPGEWIVRFRADAVDSDGSRLDTSADAQRRFLSTLGSDATIERQMEVGNVRAFHIKGPEDLDSRINDKRIIADVVPNRVMSLFATQRNAPWGLSRISARNISAVEDGVYEVSDKSGEGVDVYVVDTGVDVNHPEFEGRARWGASFVENGAQEDGQGHGTHVAGTIGSKTFGVAKKANIIAVRVLGSDGSGDTAGVIAGMEYVVNEHKKTNRPSVINMSLGGPKDKVLDDVGKEVVAAGVYLVAAGGNDNSNSCEYSPANIPEAITVASIAKGDVLAFYSNWGECIDIAAPGSKITSTWPNNETRDLDGTSMAAPHVAGALALLLAENTYKSVAEGTEALLSSASVNRIRGIRGDTPNILLYNGVKGNDVAPPTTPPPPFQCFQVLCKFWPPCQSCAWFPNNPADW
ncbi:hypothetical protein HK102_007062 [Quaeritorhiza haematococci]|nr:hypothetical protein HK102_007062 [Quaeritorhiza haematococci]